MNQATPNLPQLLEPLNRAVTPLLKLGFGNPWLFTPGATVLEVRGRRSGTLRQVPLTCYLAGGLMIIGTVRPDSQWIKNLAAADTAYVWLWGKRRAVTKVAITDNAACLSFISPAATGTVS